MLGHVDSVGVLLVKEELITTLEEDIAVESVGSTLVDSNMVGLVFTVAMDIIVLQLVGSIFTDDDGLTCSVTVI